MAACTNRPSWLTYSSVLANLYACNNISRQPLGNFIAKPQPIVFSFFVYVVVLRGRSQGQNAQYRLVPTRMTLHTFLSMAVIKDRYNGRHDHLPTFSSCLYLQNTGMCISQSHVCVWVWFILSLRLNIQYSTKIKTGLKLVYMYVKQYILRQGNTSISSAALA